MGAGKRKKKEKGKPGGGGGGEAAAATTTTTTTEEKEEEPEKPLLLPPPPPPPITRLSLAPDPSRLVPGSFTHVLLDAPCSGLGLRPRLAQHADRRFVARASAVQRALLAVAVVAAGGGGGGGREEEEEEEEEERDSNQLLLPLGENFGARTGGGRIAYSTCSVSPEENEAVVAAALRKWPRLVLEDARVALPAGIASPGLSGRGPSLAAFRDKKGNGGGGSGGGEMMTETDFLPASLAAFVLRFDPASARKEKPPESPSFRGTIGGCDTIGFFVAVFSVAPLVPRGGWVARVGRVGVGREGEGEENEESNEGGRGE